MRSLPVEIVVHEISVSGRRCSCRWCRTVHDLRSTRTMYRIISLIRRNDRPHRRRTRDQMAFEYRRFRRFMLRASPIDARCRFFLEFAACSKRLIDTRARRRINAKVYYYRDSGRVASLIERRISVISVLTFCIYASVDERGSGALFLHRALSRFRVFTGRWFAVAFCSIVIQRPNFYASLVRFYRMRERKSTSLIFRVVVWCCCLMR